MKTLAYKLQEGILDDMDDILSDVEAGAIDDWLRDYATGKYKTMKLKNGTYKVWGTVIIKNYHEDHFPPISISRLEGTMHIENCSVLDLTGLFTPECTITEELHITNCNKITDLTGSPDSIQRWLYVTACKSLGSINNGPAVVGNISVIKCKKRFKKSSIKAEYPEAATIFCSEDELSANITESLSDPILLRFMDQMKKKIKHGAVGFKFSRIFGSRDIKYDEITPSMRQTFTLPGDKKKMLTAARSIIKNKHNTEGIILCEDYNGNFIAVYGSDHNILYCRTDVEGNLTGKYHEDYWHSSTQVIKELDNYDASAQLADTKWVHIYNLNEYYGDLYSGDIAMNRQKSREGMIDNSEDGLAIYTVKQQARYAGIIAQKKVMKNLKKRTEATAKLFERYANFIRKTTEDLKWTSANARDIAKVYDAFGVGNYTVSAGLPVIYKSWLSEVKTLMRYSVATANEYEAKLDAIIVTADKALTGVGC